MKIKILNKNELDLLFFHIRLEGWNLEEAHFKTLYKVKPNDFFIAFKDDKLVGFILAIKHSNKFGMISTFLILKEYRSLGFGKTLFQYALAHLKGCQIALDSIIGYENFYKKFNFKEYFDVYTYKYITDSLKVKNKNIKIYNFNEKLSLKNKNEYQKIILKDKNIKYKELRQKNTTTSFAYILPFNDGYKITIEAHDINEAISLFLELAKEVNIKSNIYIEVSKLSPMLMDVTKVLDMKIESQLLRMYNKILK